MKSSPNRKLGIEMEKRSPVSGTIITPEQEANIQKIMEKAQLEMATNVVKALVDTLDSELFDNGLSFISPLDFLDVLGICGLSLTIGEWASYTYLTEMEKVANQDFSKKKKVGK
jgi:hypothetical protein